MVHGCIPFMMQKYSQITHCCLSPVIHDFLPCYPTRFEVRWAGKIYGRFMKAYMANRDKTVLYPIICTRLPFNVLLFQVRPLLPIYFRVTPNLSHLEIYWWIYPTNFLGSLDIHPAKQTQQNLDHIYVYAVSVSQIMEIFTGPSYFSAVPSFQIPTGPLFQIKLHLLNIVLLSGFQSSAKALKSTE